MSEEPLSPLITPGVLAAIDSLNIKKNNNIEWLFVFSIV